MAKNADIRVAIDLPYHPKIKRLKRKLGPAGAWSWLTLLCFVGSNRPDGLLAGMSNDDIAIAADWDGDPDEFVHALLEFRLLDKVGAGLVVHDWEDHNPYAAGAIERSIAASKAGKASAKKRSKEQGGDQETLWSDCSTDLETRSTDLETRSTDLETRSTVSGIRSTPTNQPTNQPSSDRETLGGFAPAHVHEAAAGEPAEAPPPVDETEADGDGRAMAPDDVPPAPADDDEEVRRPRRAVTGLPAMMKQKLIAQWETAAVGVLRGYLGTDFDLDRFVKEHHSDAAIAEVLEAIPRFAAAVAAGEARAMNLSTFVAGAYRRSNFRIAPLARAHGPPRQPTTSKDTADEILARAAQKQHAKGR